MDKINELKFERGKIVDKLRKLKDKAEEKKLSSDDLTNFRNLETEFDDVSSRIKVLEKDIESKKKEMKEEFKNERGNERDKDEFKDAYFKYLRRGRKDLSREERVTLNTQTGSEGGFLVPTTTENRIIEKLKDSNFMWRNARVEITSSDKNIPTSGGKPEFGWIDELGSYPTTDASFGQKNIGAWKTGGILKVSEELLFDETYNLENRLMTDFNDAARDKTEAGFVVGDGVKKPRGLILDAQVGQTSTAVDAVTFDEIIRLKHSLRKPYRSNASFILNDNSALALALLKNNDGQYIWRESITAGEPDRLLSNSVEYSENMADMAADAKPIAFGDISYYTIYVRRGVIMQRLNEKYADVGAVGFKTNMRVDGLLELPEAVQVLQMASV